MTTVVVIMLKTFAQNVAFAHPQQQCALYRLAGTLGMALATPMTQRLVTTTTGAHMTIVVVIMLMTFAQNVEVALPHQRVRYRLAGMRVTALATPMTPRPVTTTTGALMTIVVVIMLKTFAQNVALALRHLSQPPQQPRPQWH